MAIEAYYFTHDYNSRNDKKMVQLRRKEGMKGVGVYWCMVEMLYEEGGYLMLSELENISYELRTPFETVRKVVMNYDLFRSDDKRFWSESALARISERKAKSDRAKESALVGWKQRKQDAIALPPHSEGNAIKERKGKEKKGEGENLTHSGVFGSDVNAPFVLIIPKYASQQACRIQGADGLRGYLEFEQSILTYPEHADKFMRTHNGHRYNEMMHLKHTYEKWVAKQYQ